MMTVLAEGTRDGPVFEMCCSTATAGLGCGIRTRVIDAASRVLGGSCAAFQKLRANPTGVTVLSDASCQRHIRQHMTTRPAIIMPAVPFASRADRERALSVMTRL